MSDLGCEKGEVEVEKNEAHIPKKKKRTGVNTADLEKLAPRETSTRPTLLI